MQREALLQGKSTFEWGSARQQIVYCFQWVNRVQDRRRGVSWFMRQPQHVRYVFLIVLPLSADEQEAESLHRPSESRHFSKRVLMLVIRVRLMKSQYLRMSTFKIIFSCWRRPLRAMNDHKKNQSSRVLRGIRISEYVESSERKEPVIGDDDCGLVRVRDRVVSRHNDFGSKYQLCV